MASKLRAYTVRYGVNKEVGALAETDREALDMFYEKYVRTHVFYGHCRMYDAAGKLLTEWVMVDPEPEHK